MPFRSGCREFPARLHLQEKVVLQPQPGSVFTPVSQLPIRSYIPRTASPAIVNHGRRVARWKQCWTESAI